jgi:hypothetical protein
MSDADDVRQRVGRVREVEQRGRDQEGNREQVVQGAVGSRIQKFHHLDTSFGRFGNAVCCERTAMLKVLGWIVLVIFLIGLLVVIGVFDFIF